MTPDHSPRLVQAGGLSLAAGSAIFIATLTSFIVLFGTPEATGEGGVVTTADQARHLLSKSGIARVIWVAEALAIVLLALAGFSLSRRRVPNGSLAAYGWLAVGIGSTLYLTTYGLLLGAYWPAAQIADTNPEILAASNAAAVAIFLLSNIPINAGLAIVFSAEATLAESVSPKWLAWIGCAMATIVAGVSTYALVTDGGMQTALTAAPISGLLFVLLVFYGLRLARG